MHTALSVLAFFLITSSAQAQAALEVPGHHPAAFVPPSGAGPRPLVVALHGNFDRPEWMCAAWARIVRGRAFILCPRGIPRTDAPGQDRWQLPEAHILAREVSAARAALSARFPGRVHDGPDVWVGFSQGAHRASRLAAGDPARYPRIQLVEGGASLWRGARSYARSDGRVALVCAMPWCEQQGRRVARTIAPQRVRLERIPAAHHDLATMEPAIQRTFEWLIEGDARFTAP